MEYKEYNIKELEQCCMCIWTMKSRRLLKKSISNNILPDACIDIVIDFVNRTICFAGFSKETKDFKLNQKIDFMGVRLKPGIFYAFFHIPADKIMDHEIPFSDIEKESSIDDILDLKNTNERIECLKHYLLRKTAGAKETSIMKIVEKIYKNPNEQSVTDIAKEVGYHERNLYRVFKRNYGVSPRVLLNILRLHLSLTLILEKNMHMTDIATMCGFYDQAHFIKEIRQYTGFSPLQLVSNYH